MRIALVTESFYPAVDAATTTVKNVADRLVDTGHDVLLVAPGPGLATYRGCRVVRTHLRRDGLGTSGREVRDALTGYGPDLVHVTSPGALGRSALKQARRLGIPTLTVQQSVVGESSDYWRAKVAERSDRLLVTCSWMRSRLAEIGVDAAVWTPGIDSAAFGAQLRDDWLHRKWSRARSPEGPLVVVGYVGSLHKRNGVRRLPELAEIPGVRLVVIGDGPQKSWLRAHLPGAKFLSAMERGELAIAIASLDVLVHPGVHETDCHVLREAAASSVPVVAPEAGGAPEVVRHEANRSPLRPDRGGRPAACGRRTHPRRGATVSPRRPGPGRDRGAGLDGRRRRADRRALRRALAKDISGPNSLTRRHRLFVTLPWQTSASAER